MSCISAPPVTGGCNGAAPHESDGVPCHSVAKPSGTLLGIGLTCPSPELAQICGHAGFDVVLIDMEHGPISVETAYRMVTALAGTPAEAWIRVTWNDPALIKLALDTGARDIVVPMVTTRAEAEAAVAAAKYPPEGIRGWGPFRTQYQWRTNMLDYRPVHAALIAARSTSVPRR